MKWVALLMIIGGLVPLAWSLMQDKTYADLGLLPILFVAGFGGAALSVIGVIVMMVTLFARA